ncbi:unnamed protein product [Vicia faba]|uniref:Uncharacterized protein n=1 Tax=Vicia faba TaxID=3906 RepID=A0AAV0ZTY6_VICFA|nr:unnamed protein product [Vicia faba]
MCIIGFTNCELVWMQVGLLLKWTGFETFEAGLGLLQQGWCLVLILFDNLLELLEVGEKLEVKLLKYVVLYRAGLCLDFMVQDEFVELVLYDLTKFGLCTGSLYKTQGCTSFNDKLIWSITLEA